MGNKSALQLEVEKEMGFEIDEDLFAYLEHYARRKLEVANKSAGRAWGEDGYGDDEEEKSVGVDSDKNDLCFHRFSAVYDIDVTVKGYRRK